MAQVNLVQCRRGHGGLTVCPSCLGTGIVPEGTPGNHAYVMENGSPPSAVPSGGAVCQSCTGSGLLERHSCTGAPPAGP